ncbi:hypothetical protein [Alteromonas sp. P256]|uniref:hypothetical protein n=1 Tax=Alteromonas sp. P256 TaxID=3117399 RepID=UPI002FE2FC91
MSGIKGGHANDYSPSDIEESRKSGEKGTISGRYLPPKSRKDKIESQSLLATLDHKAFLRNTFTKHRHTAHCVSIVLAIPSKHVVIVPTQSEFYR